MHQNVRSVAVLVAAAILVAVPATPVSAAPRAACTVVTLAEVRAIVGAPVVINEGSSAPPTRRGDHTDSGCVYSPPGDIRTWKGSGSAFFFLMWGPAATLHSGYNSYMSRHWIARISGDVLATAVVSSGKAVDRAASGKLLDAVLSKLR